MDYGTRGCMVVVGGARGVSRYGMESPGVHRRRNALTGTFLTILDEETGFRLRKELFQGSLSKRQEVRITSNNPYVFATCLYKMLTMVLDMYRDPGRWSKTCIHCPTPCRLRLSSKTSARFVFRNSRRIRDFLSD